MSDPFRIRLREAREMRGLNKAELASRCGMHPSAISRFEAGHRNPSLASLRRIAHALEVTADFLLGERR